LARSLALAATPACSENPAASPTELENGLSDSRLGRVFLENVGLYATTDLFQGEAMFKLIAIFSQGELSETPIAMAARRFIIIASPSVDQ
jgi:hypothetical protein